jgi:arylsulfatase A-like enzyme
MDPHAGAGPVPYGEAVFGARPGWGQYLSKVRSGDRAVGRLLSKLDELGLSENTLVVFVSDHGESFGEHGASGHGTSVHVEQVHVPMVLRLPGEIPAGRRIADTVRSLDLYATVLDVMGWPVPSDVQSETVLPLVLGQSNGHRTAFSELYQRRNIAAPIQPQVGRDDGEYKLIADIDDARSIAGRHELYDVRSDVRERRDLAPRLPAVRDAHVDHVRRFLEHDGGATVDGRAAQSDEAEARLRALGYAR